MSHPIQSDESIIQHALRAYRDQMMAERKRAQDDSQTADYYTRTIQRINELFWNQNGRGQSIRIIVQEG